MFQKITQMFYITIFYIFLFLREYIDICGYIHWRIHIYIQVLGACPCVCTRRPGVNTGHLLPLSNLYFATTLLTDPGVHWFGETGRPVRSRTCLSLPSHCSPKVTDVYHHTRLLHGSWGPNSSPCSHTASILPTKSSPHP